jgi:hypothetical protein
VIPELAFAALRAVRFPQLRNTAERCPQISECVYHAK